MVPKGHVYLSKLAVFIWHINDLLVPPGIERLNSVKNKMCVCENLNVSNLNIENIILTKHDKQSEEST